MVRSIFPLILSLITVMCYQNCASPFDVQSTATAQHDYTPTDHVFHPFIEEFESYYKKDTSHISISFDDKMDDKYAGICYRFVVGTMISNAYIRINKTYWPTMSLLQQKNLIIHELGHCILNRDHVPSDAVHACPSSFMHYQVMDDVCLQQHYDEYIKEMFP